MATRNLYDILDVSRSASADVIRRAYLQKSKQVHPDRFDQFRQRDEWNLANERLKELNAAYAILRDPVSRAKYDAECSGGPAAGAQAHQKSPEQTWAEQQAIFPSNIRGGKARYEDLPKHIQDRLVERVKGAVGGQHRVELDSPMGLYIFALLLLGWPWWLVSSSSGVWRYGWFDVLCEYKWWTLFFSLMQASSVTQIMKWHQSAITPCLVFTPLYVIKTTFNSVHYWPIWTLKSINSTDLYTQRPHRSPSYQGTDTVIFFENDEVRLPRTANVEDVGPILRAAKEFMSKAQAAAVHNDRSYFETHDDFRGFDSPSDPSFADSERMTDVERMKMLVLMFGYLVCLALALRIAIGR